MEDSEKFVELVTLLKAWVSEVESRLDRLEHNSGSPSCDAGKNFDKLFEHLENMEY